MLPAGLFCSSGRAASTVHLQMYFNTGTRGLVGGICLTVLLRHCGCAKLCTGTLADLDRLMWVVVRVQMFSATETTRKSPHPETAICSQPQPLMI